MIHYVQRADLEVEKYNDCIANSIQSSIYAFSWYLDIVADHWDVLVLNDYEAVMPIPWRKKYGIKYVYPPYWLLELGVFSIDKALNVNPFLRILLDRFKFVELRLNTNNLKVDSNNLISRRMQILSLDTHYDILFKQYRKDRKKDVQKAIKNHLVEKWNDPPENLISLLKNNVGKRIPHVIEKDYLNLLKLMHNCIEKRVGEVLSIYDVKNRLVASGFFLKNKKELSLLVSSTDFKNRKNGANTYLIDRAIYKYQNTFKTFNFGGSSMQTIAKYFLSFGAETKQYQQIKYNNLPFLLRLIKK